MCEQRTDPNQIIAMRQVNGVDVRVGQDGVGPELVCAEFDSIFQDIAGRDPRVRKCRRQVPQDAAMAGRQIKNVLYIAGGLSCATHRMVNCMQGRLTNLLVMPHLIRLEHPVLGRDRLVYGELVYVAESEQPKRYLCGAMVGMRCRWYLEM